MVNYHQSGAYEGALGARRAHPIRVPPTPWGSTHRVALFMNYFNDLVKKKTSFTFKGKFFHTN